MDERFSNRPAWNDEVPPVEVDDDAQEDAPLLEDAAWSASECEYSNPTRRLAVVNCDWDHIRVADLFAILSQALPLGGQLHKVEIFLSDFGKKMMELERCSGPDLWAAKGEAAGLPTVRSSGPSLSHDEDEEEPLVDDDGWVEEDPAMLTEEGANGEIFSSGKHRKYEKDRMKYYYAVATFDEDTTAETVYHELEGVDVESSGIALDLRYVDEEELFLETAVAVASSVPPNFKPLAAFKCSAMSQSRFTISWDQDDVFRTFSLRDAFAKDTAADDLAAYIADSDSDDEESKEAKRRAIRSKFNLLNSTMEEPGEKLDGSAASSDDDDLNDAPELFGDRTATIDVDAPMKAQQLQQSVVKRRAAHESNLGEQRLAASKSRRKEAKKEKKGALQLLQSEQIREEENFDRIKAVLGDSAVVTSSLSNKEKKALRTAQLKKAEVSRKLQKKHSRIVGSGQQPLNDERCGTRPTDTVLDTRFANRLLLDPRFHIDLNKDTGKRQAAVSDLARNVVVERTAKKRARREQ